MKRGLSIPTLAEPDRILALGQQAEDAGWDGVFLWEHTHGSPEAPMPVADTWVVLGALAARTERVRLGTAITPAARRLPQELARQVVTLDHLSGGRAVLGVGLGEPPEEYTAYGTVADRKVLASRLDEALVVLDGLWSGEPFTHHGEHFTVESAQFLPRAVQPRVPVWASCTHPHTAPLARAARHGGAVLAKVAATGAIEPVPLDFVEEAVATLAAGRPAGAPPLDVVVSHPGLPDRDHVAELERLGATWLLVTGWLDDLPALVAEGSP
jgi:alkanesulfonate monooxygenase SsuD/methylene tetrahydromethanopterin reductase-like flavin-dependent oxidoreductase (luciferase family)